MPPALRRFKKYGIGISETVLVTENGCEVITNFPRDLYIAYCLIIIFLTIKRRQGLNINTIITDELVIGWGLAELLAVLESTKKISEL